MNTVELFFTPIVFQSAKKTCEQRVIEACDGYFYFSGKKILILADNTTLLCKENPPDRNTFLTVLKIASFCTVIIPTLFFLGKLLFRPKVESPSLRNIKVADVDLAPQMTKPKRSLFSRLFSAPYDTARLLRFGLSDSTIEQSKTLREKLSSMSENECNQTAAPNISFRDLERLFGCTWLNDTCINEYLRLLLRGKKNTCFIHSLSVSHHKLKRITQPYNIFQTHDGVKLKMLYDTQKTIFVPLHVANNHWALLVCDLHKKTLHYYDSLSSRPPEVVQEVKEHLEKIAHIEGIVLEANAFELTQEKCPKQENSYDCGVFTLLAAKHIIEESPLTYSQQDAPYMRLKILSDFLNYQ